MKTIRTIVAAASFLLALSSAVVAAEASDTQIESGLNMYCDPVGSIYLGGTPLFNEATGERLSREEYLRSKGLNIYCDPIGTVYPGGKPQSNEMIGEQQSREDFLRLKVL